MFVKLRFILKEQDIRKATFTLPYWKATGDENPDGARYKYVL